MTFMKIGLNLSTLNIGENMRTFLLLFLLFLSCAAPKASLLRYSETVYPAKPEDCAVEVVNEIKADDFLLIGQVKVTQDVGYSQDKVLKELKRGCCLMGGDALMNIKQQFTDSSNPLMPVIWIADVIKMKSVGN